KYVSSWTAKDNTSVTIRPILPEDEKLLVRFHADLSDRSVFLRYLQPMMFQERVVHERLSRICHCDYDREIALVAEKKVDGESIIMGVVRLSKLHANSEGRLSILVADPYQGTGLGGEMVRRMIDVAKQEHLEKISAILTDDNQVMGQLFKKLGFTIEATAENPKLMNALLML
ncbi:MAG TPA: GNAT family protein, partial [Anaerolineales bacterium]|nr:GNAT family protein [Anaerolineales bacterium]